MIKREKEIIELQDLNFLKPAGHSERSERSEKRSRDSRDSAKPVNSNNSLIKRISIEDLKLHRLDFRKSKNLDPKSKTDLILGKTLFISDPHNPVGDKKYFCGVSKICEELILHGYNTTVSQDSDKKFLFNQNSFPMGIESEFRYLNKHLKEQSKGTSKKKFDEEYSKTLINLIKRKDFKNLIILGFSFRYFETIRKEFPNIKIYFFLGYLPLETDSILNLILNISKYRIKLLVPSNYTKILLEETFQKILNDKTLKLSEANRLLIKCLLSDIKVLHLALLPEINIKYYSSKLKPRILYLDRICKDNLSDVLFKQWNTYSHIPLDVYGPIYDREIESLLDDFEKDGKISYKGIVNGEKELEALSQYPYKIMIPGSCFSMSSFKHIKLGGIPLICFDKENSKAGTGLDDVTRPSDRIEIATDFQDRTVDFKPLITYVNNKLKNLKEQIEDNSLNIKRQNIIQYQNELGFNLKDFENELIDILDD